MIFAYAILSELCPSLRNPTLFSKPKSMMVYKPTAIPQPPLALCLSLKIQPSHQLPPTPGFPLWNGQAGQAAPRRPPGPSQSGGGSRCSSVSRLRLRNDGPCHAGWESALDNIPILGTMVNGYAISYRASFHSSADPRRHLI